MGGGGGLCVTRNFPLGTAELPGVYLEPGSAPEPSSEAKPLPQKYRRRSWPGHSPLLPVTAPQRPSATVTPSQAKAPEILQFTSPPLSARTYFISLCIFAGAALSPAPTCVPAPAVPPASEPRAPRALTWWQKGKVPPRSGSSPGTGKVSG